MTRKARGDELVFLPLGGVGEIGMNLALYGFGPPKARQWIMVDCGVTFPGPDMPSVDVVMADIGFIEAEVDNLHGIVITHAHEDHYGAIGALWARLKAPVWVTPFTEGLIEARHNQGEGGPKIPLNIYRAGDRFDVGPFGIETISVTHSIPEPVSLAITTPAGTVIHTGDWKIDPAPSLGGPTDEHAFRELGKKGVLALICDSTNALREGDSPSEQAVGESLARLIAEAPGRVAITTFSSNVGRIRSIAAAARSAGRRVMVLGRSLKRVIDVAAELGYLEGIDEFLAEEDFSRIPRREIVILCTGSQGEPRAALAKLAREELRDISLAAGDTVIYSSRVIPGNEKAILDIKNRLIDQGIRIIEDGDALVHVSGHPRRNELRVMYEWTRPEILVPVHGEAAHLSAQAQLGREAGVPQVAEVRNGDMLRLWPGAAEIIDQVGVGRIYKDGNLVGNFEELGLGDRRKLSYVGHVAVNVVLDDGFQLAGDPDLVAFGLPLRDAEGESMEERLLDAVTGAIESMPRARRKDLDAIAEAARRAARSAANDAWGRKPVVTVFVTR
jgi:ribonuclease J